VKWRILDAKVACGKDPKMEEILAKYKKEKENLIQILNEVQEYYGYVPEKAQVAISEYLSMPMAEIYGVVTFYSRFTLKPKGKYHIAVCLGTACFVKGSEKVLDRAKERLGIESAQTTELDFNPNNLSAIKEGMRGVTSESGGTAYSYFKNFNIEVGGKTGSAEAGKKTHGWFVGFAPFDNPEIAVVGMVENGWHGSYVAEVVRDIISEYFGMNIQEVNEDVTASPEVEFIR